MSKTNEWCIDCIWVRKWDINGKAVRRSFALNIGQQIFELNLQNWVRPDKSHTYFERHLLMWIVKSTFIGCDQIPLIILPFSESKLFCINVSMLACQRTVLTNYVNVLTNYENWKQLFSEKILSLKKYTRFLVKKFLVTIWRKDKNSRRRILFSLPRF